MAAQMTEDNEGAGSARDEPGASNRRVGIRGMGMRAGVLRCGGDQSWFWWWMGGGERENEAVFCKIY